MRGHEGYQPLKYSDQTPTTTVKTEVPDSSPTAVSSSQTYDQKDADDAVAAAIAKAAKANTENLEIALRIRALNEQAKKAREAGNTEGLQEAVAQAKEEMGRAMKASKERDMAMKQALEATKQSVEAMKQAAEAFQVRMIEEMRRQSEINPGGDGA